jgi:hypothetical protein
MKKTLTKTLFLLLCILGLIFLFRNNIAEELLLQTINKRLNLDSARVYDINCEDVVVEVIEGNISLINVEVSARLEENLLRGKNLKDFPLLVNGNFKKIKVKGFSWLDFWSSYKLHVDVLFFDRSTVKLLLGNFKSGGSNLEIIEYTEAVADIFSSIEVGQIIVDNCSIDLAKTSTPLLSIIYLDSLSLVFDEILIDSVQSRRNPFWFFENMEFDLKSVKSSLDSNYRLEANNLSVSASGQTLSLQNFKISPFDIDESTQVDDINRDYFSLYIPEVSLMGIDYKEAVRSGNISVDEVFINHARFEYLIDLVNINQGKIEALLPSVFLRAIKTNIKVNKTTVSDGEVQLSLKTDVSTKPVTLSFNKISGKVKELAFGKDWCSSRPLRIDINSYFQNEARLHLNFIVSLDVSKNDFFVRGQLGEMSMKSLNPVIEATSFVSTRSGILHKLDFDFIARKKNSEGRLLMDYSNLSMVFLKELSPSNIKRRRKYYLIDTYLANNIVKHHNNPRGLFFREGYITVERPPSLNFWSYLWVSLQSGISHSLVQTETKKKAKIRRYKKWRNTIARYN